MTTSHSVVVYYDKNTCWVLGLPAGAVSILTVIPEDQQPGFDRMMCSLHIKLRAVPEIILKGSGLQALFCPVGGGWFVDNVSKGWGWGGGGNLSWGSRHI